MKRLNSPLLSDPEAFVNADILFVVIWFYGDNITRQFGEYLGEGGRMLFPSVDKEPYLVGMLKNQMKNNPLSLLPLNPDYI